MKSSAISIRSSAAGNWQRQSICFGCQKGAVISQLASWLTGIYSWEAVGMTREWLLTDNITPAETIVKMMFSSMPENLRSIFFKDGEDGL